MNELPFNEVIHTGTTRPGEIDYDASFARCLLGYNCQIAGDNARAVRRRECARHVAHSQLLLNKGINNATVLQCQSGVLRGAAAGRALCKANVEAVLNPVKEHCDKWLIQVVAEGACPSIGSERGRNGFLHDSWRDPVCLT